MTVFKNLNQLKKNLLVGQKVRVNNVMKNVAEDRIVLKVQTNAIYTGKEIEYSEYVDKKSNWMTENHVKEVDGKYFTNTYLPFQKAKHMNFNGSKIQFLAFECETSYGGTVLSPSPDFKVGDTWLELEFI